MANEAEDDRVSHALVQGVEEESRLHTRANLTEMRILLFGSAAGAQIGARISKRLKADQLKTLLAVLVLTVMVEALLRLLIAPEIILSCPGGR